MRNKQEEMDMLSEHLDSLEVGLTSDYHLECTGSFTTKEHGRLNLTGYTFFVEKADDDLFVLTMTMQSGFNLEVSKAFVVRHFVLCEECVKKEKAKSSSSELSKIVEKIKENNYTMKVEPKRNRSSDIDDMELIIKYTKNNHWLVESYTNDILFETEKDFKMLSNDYYIKKHRDDLFEVIRVYDPEDFRRILISKEELINHFVVNHTDFSDSILKMYRRWDKTNKVVEEIENLEKEETPKQTIIEKIKWWFTH